MAPRAAAAPPAGPAGGAALASPAAPASPGLSDNVWGQKALVPRFPRLDVDAECDVCVVVRFTGLSTALQLARAGKSVVVLEGRVRGAGNTGRTSGEFGERLFTRSNTRSTDRPPAL
jgi:hypothetical protein